MPTAFDLEKYIELQTQALRERITEQGKVRIYLEVGGELFDDYHAERVLPGFDPKTKAKVLSHLPGTQQYLICVNANYLENNLPRHSRHKSYIEEVEGLMTNCQQVNQQQPTLVINFISEKNQAWKGISESWKERGFEIVTRNFIRNYPEDTDLILSKVGFGAETLPNLKGDLIILTGVSANSGKLSTALSFMYQDRLKGEMTGFAKYELFPIWDLPKNHPINLAYEAATADIGDRVLSDEREGQGSVNYSRDLKAFSLLLSLSEIGGTYDPLKTYKSTTDMGVNMASKCILDEEEVSLAAIKEIGRRLNIYEQAKNEMARSHCAEILTEAQKYMDQLIPKHPG